MNRRQLIQTGAAAGAPPQLEFDPVAWWDLLQSQFGQIATAAITSIPTLPLPPHPAMTPFGAGIAVPPGAGAASAGVPPGAASPAQGATPRGDAAASAPAAGATSQQSGAPGSAAPGSPEPGSKRG